MNDPLLFDVEGRIGYITFNRPSRLNAMNLEMATAMASLTSDLRTRTDLTVVVLRGAGGAFMAGGDVELFHGNMTQVVATLGDLFEQLHQFVITLQELPQIVVGSVHGAAAGGGFSLAIGTDLTIAAESASFTPAYLKLGTSPDGGGTFFLPRLIGPKRALEMFTLGKPCPAPEAARLGIINRAVADQDLAGETLSLADRLSKGAAFAIAQTKKLLRADIEALRQHLAAERAAFLKCAGTSDFAEGVSAFLQKRTRAGF